LSAPTIYRDYFASKKIERTKLQSWRNKIKKEKKASIGLSHHRRRPPAYPPPDLRRPPAGLPPVFLRTRAGLPRRGPSWRMRRWCGRRWRGTWESWSARAAMSRRRWSACTVSPGSTCPRHTGDVIWEVGEQLRPPWPSRARARRCWVVPVAVVEKQTETPPSGRCRGRGGGASASKHRRRRGTSTSTATRTEEESGALGSSTGDAWREAGAGEGEPPVEKLQATPGARQGQGRRRRGSCQVVLG
jgi:hypothetical protein